MGAAILLKRGHQIGNVAHHEQVAGIAIEHQRRVNARIATCHDQDLGRLPLPGQLLEQAVVALEMPLPEALETFDEIARDRGHAPVSKRWASRYLSAVFCSTSAGICGAGGCLFQPEDSSQSRTNCLSKLGGLLPTLYWAAGQKRDESGVSASSIRYSLPALSVPNSNLVSAMMMPRVSA